MIDTVRGFLGPKYEVLSDIWWVMTEEVPTRGAEPVISAEVKQTVAKISRVVDFTVSFAYYTAKTCWYFTALNIGCHLFTRLFSATALSYFFSSIFFGILTSDLYKLERETTCVKRQFFRIQGPKDTLEESEEISFNLTKESGEPDTSEQRKQTAIHLQGAISHLDDLQNSFYLLKYPFMPLLEGLSNHLSALEASLHFSPNPEER